MGHDRDQSDRHDPFDVARGERSCPTTSATRCAHVRDARCSASSSRSTDDEGKELPRDGKAFGALKVRGPWVASSYYKRSGDDVFEADGWFNTGDVATICPLGYMQITDRTKDVIKSGGEWISSIELENLAVAHPAVAQAAAIAIAHPKWQERPLLVAVLKPGASVTREEVLEFFLGKVAKWWIPDDVVFVDKLPLTATGKLSKLQLRQQFADYKFP